MIRAFMFRVLVVLWSLSGVVGCGAQAQVEPGTTELRRSIDQAQGQEAQRHRRVIRINMPETQPAVNRGRN